MLGLYLKEEEGHLINYIITNPAAASMYELLSDAMSGFRQPFPSRTLSSHVHHVCLSSFVPSILSVICRINMIFGFNSKM